jgi:hypothetical protein
MEISNLSITKNSEFKNNRTNIHQHQKKLVLETGCLICIETHNAAKSGDFASLCGKIMEVYIRELTTVPKMEDFALYQDYGDL